MSQYAQEIKHILATLNEPGNGNEHPLPDEESLETIHVYPVEGGGLLFSPTELEPEPPIIDSQKQPTDAKEPPFFLYFCLILCFFLLFDVADNQLLALMTPTATITITPSVRTITLTSSMQLGKLLSPITLSESQTVPATGHGHQDAQRATGTLTFYNGLSMVQSIAAGTVFTGSDGVQVATEAIVTIAANNPPNDGEAQVSAHAVNAGSNGNIQAEDINLTLSAGLYVKNLVPFVNGQDERDYSIVTKADTDAAASTLQAKVTASMTAALQSQLTPAEQMHMKPCRPTVTADHRVGEEATQLTVTVSEMCAAIAYNTQELSDQGTRLLTAQAVQTVGKGYMLFGDVKVTVTKADTTNKTGVLLSFTTQGSYVYQLTAPLQERIKTLIAGKPRLTALQLLSSLPGVHRVTIAGIADSTPLPEDPQHIHFLVLVGL